MSEMIRIRSIKEYFQEFAVDGIGKGQPVDLVKEQILDAFRKEIFDQIMWKLKVDDISKAEETPENHTIVENIMKNSYKKWLGVIKLFNRYRETLNILKPEDLQLLDEQRETYDPLDGFDDEEENEEETEDEEDIPEDSGEDAVREEEEAGTGGMAVDSTGTGRETGGNPDSTDGSDAEPVEVTLEGAKIGIIPDKQESYIPLARRGGIA